MAGKNGTCGGFDDADVVDRDRRRKIGEEPTERPVDPPHDLAEHFLQVTGGEAAHGLDREDRLHGGHAAARGQVDREWPVHRSLSHRRPSGRVARWHLVLRIVQTCSLRRSFSYYGGKNPAPGVASSVLANPFSLFKEIPMRVRAILVVLAAAGLAVGCSERAELLAPSDQPALDGGIFTIGSDGRQGTTSEPAPTPTGTNPDSTTALKGILTIGSGG